MRKSHSNLITVLNIQEITLEKAIYEVADAAFNKQALPVRFINAWSVVCASESDEYLEKIKTSGLNLCDSFALAKFLKCYYKKVEQTQIRGNDFFKKFLGKYFNLNHILIGPTFRILDKMEERITDDFPNTIITKKIAPGQIEDIDSFVNELAEYLPKFNGDVIWLGLGSPKQDLISSKLAPKINMPVIGIGAAFEYYSGEKNEAPLWIRKFGLEWFYRLITNPKRLWRRYLIGNFKFMLIALFK